MKTVFHFRFVKHNKRPDPKRQAKDATERAWQHGDDACGHGESEILQPLHLSGPDYDEKCISNSKYRPKYAAKSVYHRVWLLIWIPGAGHWSRGAKEVAKKADD